MATLASFHVDLSNAPQLFAMSNKYLVVGAVFGLIQVVDLQCRHVDILDKCEHRVSIDTDKIWALDCYEDILIVGNADGTVRIWDPCTGLLKSILSGHTTSVKRVLIIDSDTVVTADDNRTVIVWNIHTARPQHILTDFGDDVQCLKHRKNILFAGSHDGMVTLWNLDNGERVRVLEGHDTPVWQISFNQDASLIITAAAGGPMRIWDVATWNCIAKCEGHSKIVNQFVNDGDDQLITGAADGSIRTWEWKTGKLLSTLTPNAEERNAIRGLVLTPRYMIVGGTEGRVRVWDRREGTWVEDLRPKTEVVWQFANKDDLLVLVMKIGQSHQLVEMRDISSFG